MIDNVNRWVLQEIQGRTAEKDIPGEVEVTILLDYIKSNGQTMTSLPLSQSLPDHDDEPFLEVALAGKVVCLVTGNLGHFPVSLRQGIKIYSSSEFLTFYKKQGNLHKRR
jgi:predicted nucleic acid-binding protein